MISNLKKAFENRIKLGVMSILMVNEWVEYNTLKAMLEVTDGNLASHLKALKKEDYIEEKKAFIGKKPNTSYRITSFGKVEFKAHIMALNRLLNND